MKKIFLFSLIAVFGLFGAEIAKAEAQNYIPDGNMEKLNSISYNGWGRNTDWGNTNENVLQGDSSMVVGKNTGFGGFSVRVSDLEPGEEYLFSFYHDISSGKLYNIIGLNQANADFERSYTRVKPTRNGWERYARKFVVPNDLAGRDMVFRFSTQGGMTFIDNIKLQKTSELPLIFDGDMEEPLLEEWMAWGNNPVNYSKVATTTPNEDSVQVMKLDGLIGGAGLVQKNISVQAGREYKLSFKARVDSGKFTVSFGNNANVDANGYWRIYKTRGAWVEKSRIYKGEDFLNGKAVLRFAAGGGISYIDDIVLEDVTLSAQSGTASVALNDSFLGHSSSNPNGTVNASDVKIGSFIITAGSGEAIDVTQIQLKDDEFFELGHNFENLVLKQGGVQIGSTISSLNISFGGYTFTPSEAIRIPAGEELIVDVYADIKSNANNVGNVLSPIAKFDSVTATGVSTSVDTSYTTDVNLQDAYISDAGNLTISIDSETPASTQLVMGQTNREMARFKLTANAAEDINISRIDLSNNVSTAASGTLKNVRLYMDGVPVSPSVNFDLGNSIDTNVRASFRNLDITIPKNTTKVLVVKADVTSYEDGGVSGSTHTLALLVDFGIGSPSVEAYGASSGVYIDYDRIVYGTNPNTDQIANQMTVYRTKATIAWAADTPSGSAVGATNAIVAKLVISNSANIGNYKATVEALNFKLVQTGISNTANRNMNIYKDSVSTAALATTSWNANENFGNTSILNENFTDVEIAAGGSKLFIVTLDTVDAGSDDKMSIYIDRDDVVWSDGATASIDVMPDHLPLSTKTLTY